LGTSLPSRLVPHQVSTFDKVVHFSFYAVFGFLLARAALRGKSLIAVLALVIIGVACFGAVDEWHQQFIPGRYMDVQDWAADAAGGIAGAVAAVLFNQLRTRQKQA